MSESSHELPFELLVQQLKEKRNLYNQMLSKDKQFEEVKTLFLEIRDLEKSIHGKQEKASQSESDMS